MGDVMDIARGLKLPVFGQPANTLEPAKAAKSSNTSAFSLRLNLKDVPGIMAQISTALADAGVSIDRMRQFSHDDISAPVMIVTHPTKRDIVEAAFARIAGLNVTTQAPLMLSIVDA